MSMKLGHVPEEERQPSLVSPVLAAILSVIPGLGQVLGRAVRRGLVLFFSFITLLGLMAWRFALAAPRDTGWLNIIKKAFHLQPIMIFLSILIGILWIWIVVDAYRTAKDPRTNPVGLFFMVIVVYFVVGWQIGQIDLFSLFTKADDALPALSRVLWPWEQAVFYPEEHLVIGADIQIPCTESPPEPSEAPEGEPLLVSNPTCGILSEQDGTQGSTLTLTGTNLMPGDVAEIYWKDPIGNEFRQRQGGEYIKVTPDADGSFQVDIIMPYRLIPADIDEVLIWEVQARQLASVGDPQPSSELKLALEKIVETIFIGMMATFFGIIFALPVSFFAARNLMSASPVTLVIYYLVRAVLNIIRSIEPIIWAIIAVIVVGLGPFAGILALTVHSIAALGKLYSESIESIDPGPIEAIHATGADWVQTVMYAVVPQIIPPFVSFTIYRWDINIRMSTVIGIVGGGGIGFLLIQWIRLLDYDAAGIAVWFIAITVAILDYISAEIRVRFV
jgi:phosphonate transport system permease protein